MIGIIAYGAGNLHNLQRGLRFGGFEAVILENPGKAEQAELLLLPGVGAFAPAMEALNRSGWGDQLRHWHQAERPLLGICLGMQLLCRESFEKEHTPGLGFLDASVELLSGAPKLPHMGWNSLEWQRPFSPALLPSSNPSTCSTSLASSGDASPATNLSDETFYFVHSYGVLESPHTLATTTTGEVTFASVLGRGKVLGMQFHPERSGPRGVAFLARVLRQYTNTSWEGIV
jgi:glutamine amidotransferase